MPYIIIIIIIWVENDVSQFQASSTLIIFICFIHSLWRMIQNIKIDFSFYFGPNWKSEAPIIDRKLYLKQSATNN